MTVALVGTTKPRRKPRMRRVGPQQPHSLTGSQREVLSLLHAYGFLTPRLLAAAYGAREGRDGRGYWHLQRELRRLFDAGLVQRFSAVATAVRNGSSECVYVITHLGARAILDSNEYAAVRHEVYQRQGKQRANFEHHVAIASLQLILTLGQQTWSLSEFRADERNPKACARVQVRGRALVAWPDAMSLIEVGDSGRRLKYLFELDLSRKNNQRVEDRFLAYATYLVERRRREVARTPVGSVVEDRVVVFAVTHEGELERFLDIAGRVLSAWPTSERPCFLFWNMQDWYAVPEGGADNTGRPLAPGVVLRPAREILAEASLVTVEGASRRLVEEGTRA